MSIQVREQSFVVICCDGVAYFIILNPRCSDTEQLVRGSATTIRVFISSTKQYLMLALLEKINHFFIIHCVPVWKAVKLQEY